MAKFSRDKGLRVERMIKEKHLEMGVQCERVPLSGAAGGSFCGDLLVDDEFIAEVKSRKDGEGFKTLEKWLGGNDMLFLHRNNADPMVVMPWATYKRVMSTEVKP